MKSIETKMRIFKAPIALRQPRNSDMKLELNCFVMESQLLEHLSNCCHQYAKSSKICFEDHQYLKDSKPSKVERPYSKRFRFIRLCQHTFFEKIHK